MITLETNELQVGKVYSYRELCELFSEKQATSDSKKAQLKRWACNFNWDYPINPKTKKPSKKFRIVEVYDTPLEKVDNRKHNGKHENSLKSLEEHRHVQESFFEPNELQLALLWLLGYHGYTHGIDEDTAFTVMMPQHELYVAIGLCNDFFRMLSRDKHYYAKKSSTDEGEFHLWMANITLDGIYSDMRSKTMTAFNQLQRKKVLHYSYWKSYGTSTRKEIPFTDKQMKLFLSIRQDTFEWWEEVHPDRTVPNIGDVYMKLTPKEVREFEEKLLELLMRSGHFDGITHYSSCFKVTFDIRTIKRELSTRGYDTGETMLSFLSSYREGMQEVVSRVNNKFLERCDGVVASARKVHLEKWKEYERKALEYSEKHSQRQRREGVKGFGKTLKPVEPPKRVYVDLLDYEMYNKTIELVHLGISMHLTMEQLSLLQGIEYIISVKKSTDD